MPLLIDTDTGSDDAVALLLAVKDGDVRAVTTVAGNVPLETATRNALITLDLAGHAAVPVHPGCDRPLTRPPSTAQHVHGLDGMGDTGLPDPARGPADGHAVDVLLSLPRRHPGELTLVTLGPLTNLAAALLRDRELLTRFRHVYCMAGAADLHGNVTPTAEFNVWADPEAARVVLRAATPGQVTWIGWDVSRRYAVMTPTTSAGSKPSALPWPPSPTASTGRSPTGPATSPACPATTCPTPSRWPWPCTPSWSSTASTRTWTWRSATRPAASSSSTAGARRPRPT
ncbi:Inosine-uridine preferring nucleoside hydrolase [[Actinomadura] parvosata subsp. kistnae]|nr:Inosine-uridine preferring nucleoside hydrolase [Actinomadura parvosata subsp. kistnae]